MRYHKYETTGTHNVHLHKENPKPKAKWKDFKYDASFLCIFKLVALPPNVKIKTVVTISSKLDFGFSPIVANWMSHRSVYGGGITC